MWLKKLRRLIRLFFFQLTGKKGDKVAKLTKPVIAVNIDGTVRVLNQDPNATHFNWYTRELLSYNITSPNYDVVVAGTNESTTALPNSSYTNRVYITESYRDIRKFTSFKLYEAGSSAVDVTELYVTKISDFEYSISIPNVEHDYIITWGVGAITYTITSSLTNCVADKSDESYVGGTAVNIVITAAAGYTFDSSLGGTIGLSVGEVDKTSEYMARSSDNKKVTIEIPAIAAVGNIIYAAGAVEEHIEPVIPTDCIVFIGETSDFTLTAHKSWDNMVEYSTDKNTWSEWHGTEISSSNKKLYLRGISNTSFRANESANLSLSAKAACYGNINTLLKYWDPPTTLSSNYCYYGMFMNCTLLTRAPELPATTLSNYCYNRMFYGCTSLTTAPELPATTLGEGCYQDMFYGCTSLTSAPELPATTVEYSCYRSMFEGCTGIKISATQTGEYTTAWRLPSTGEITSEPGWWNVDMLKGTGGTFTGKPSRNTIYYGAW